MKRGITLRHWIVLGLIALSLALAVSVFAQPTTKPSHYRTNALTNLLPTATLAPTPKPAPGKYENAELGVSFTYPHDWTTSEGEDPSTLARLTSPTLDVFAIALYNPMPADTTLEDEAREMLEALFAGLGDIEASGAGSQTLADGRQALVREFSATTDDSATVIGIVAATARGERMFTLLAFGLPDGVRRERQTIHDMIASLRLEAPRVYGIPRDQALFLPGGESDNPRAYDPANGSGSDLVFSGLVTYDPQLEVVPDLAESWDISADGRVYTFHLRKNARFHDGRPVTAQDVIYSWERAADPQTESDTVLTYLGDIAGVREMHAGRAKSIRGLKAIDDHTLQVTLDAPKPYFILKLTFNATFVVDRANVESGTDWYRAPNGTGPYRLIRWDRFKLQLYERDDDWYLDPPAIRFIVAPLFSGDPLRLYETGDIDVTGVGPYNADRVLDPEEPLHADLREGVSMCTSFVTFDTTQPPFDDPKVRQAFALAVDRQRYVDVVLRGKAITAHGLYPPALPGYDLSFKGLGFDPGLARQRLAQSTYGSANRLPPIVFTSSGYGSDIDSDVAALAQMWKTHLGVTIEVENLEPDKFFDKLHDGEHGPLFMYGWCADYADPENFADVLFHSQAQQNLGHYSNPALDALLEQARVERDVAKRIAMYKQAERIIVEDAAGIFLDHSLSFLLVKPHIQDYVLTPIAVPIERYLSIDVKKMEK